MINRNVEPPHTTPATAMRCARCHVSISGDLGATTRARTERGEMIHAACLTADEYVRYFKEPRNQTQTFQLRAVHERLPNHDHANAR